VLETARVHVRTHPRRCAEPVLLEDRHGPVALYPLPYLEPVLAAGPLGLADGVTSHEAVLGAAMGAVRADLSGRPAGTRSVVSAHAFVVGGQACDSERDIGVGGVAAVPSGLFDGVDYTALGHLHGRQRITDTVRYSGSPLAYSFSEQAHTKGSWLVTLGAGGVEAVEPVEAPVPRPLALLRGRLDELLGAPAHARHEGSWCRVTLTDAERPPEAMQRLRTRFPHTLELRFEPEGVPAGDGLTYAERVSGRGELDVCCGFLEHVRSRAASGTEVEVLRSAVEDLRLDDAERLGAAALRADRRERRAARAARTTAPAVRVELPGPDEAGPDEAVTGPAALPAPVTDGFGTLDALDVLGVVMTPEPEPAAPVPAAAPRRRRPAAPVQQASLFEEAG